jgi:acetyl-CoA carboxylase carboxyl transferase subunit beta
MRVRAVDLLEHGTAHHVVPEPDDDTGVALAVAVAAEIGAAIRLCRS